MGVPRSNGSNGPASPLTSCFRTYVPDYSGCSCTSPPRLCNGPKVKSASRRIHRLRAKRCPVPFFWCPRNSGRGVSQPGKQRPPSGSPPRGRRRRSARSLGRAACLTDYGQSSARDGKSLPTDRGWEHNQEPSRQDESSRTRRLAPRRCRAPQMRKDISEATSPITPAEWLGDPTKIIPLSQQRITSVNNALLKVTHLATLYGQISQQPPSVASLQGEAPRRGEIGYGPSHFIGAEGPGVENDPMPWAI